jgi:predicted GH43/DUF377 family glycosyl hydrolase
MNPGVFLFDDKIWLILRVAERPEQKEGTISFPILDEKDEIKILEFDKNAPDIDLSDPRHIKYNGTSYLSTISHLRLVCSEDGIRFYEPDGYETKIFGKGALESFGIEDCRVTEVKGSYYLTFTEVSENGVGVGLMHTRDWKNFNRQGMIFPPHNKDCALFNEKIRDKYYCLNRPSGLFPGGNYLWLSSSPDLKFWGEHTCILRTRKGMWDSARVGAGAEPIKTPDGWLEIYHGANEEYRYCLGALLLDLEDPSKVLARSKDPIMEPEMDYEQEGFFGNVIFTNGHWVNDDQIHMYYGASDTVICGATFSIKEIMSSLR